MMGYKVALPYFCMNEMGKPETSCSVFVDTVLNI